MSSSGFSADPWPWQNANLRASTSDRDELIRILGDAYARGQLDDLEYEERMHSALQIKLLGEVRPLIIDLGEPEKLLARRPSAGAVQRRRGSMMTWKSAATIWVSVAAVSNLVYLVGVGLGAPAAFYWPILFILVATIYPVARITAERPGGGPPTR